jgi:hypothetical protein
MLLALALLLMQPPGYEGPPLTPKGEAANSAAMATAMAQGAYIACARAGDAARVERDYLQLGADAHDQAVDYEHYLRLWQQAAGHRADGSWTARACDDWSRDLAERQLENATAFFRELVHPETARPPEATMRVLTLEQAQRATLQGPVREADLFARGAVVRAIAEHMICRRTAEAETLEARLMAVERTIPDALYDDRTLAQLKYQAGQSRDGGWPRPPGHQCLAEDRQDLDGDAEGNLRDLEAAAHAYLAALH